MPAADNETLIWTTTRKKKSPTAKKPASGIVKTGTGYMVTGSSAYPAKAAGALKSRHVAAIVRFASSDTMTVIAETRKGISSGRLVELTEALDIPRIRFIETMRLGRSTIEQRIKRGDVLTPTESDAVLRASRVLARAIEVLEDEDDARAWIKRDLRSLGGVSPLSLLDTETGYELVLNTLGRIEQGIVA